jgi:hypothetical protein
MVTIPAKKNAMAYRMHLTWDEQQNVIELYCVLCVHMHEMRTNEMR